MWTTICIPGDDERGTPAAWFAYHRQSRESVSCADAAEARLVCAMLNGGALLTA